MWHLHVVLSDEAEARQEHGGGAVQAGLGISPATVGQQGSGAGWIMIAFAKNSSDAVACGKAREMLLVG